MDKRKFAALQMNSVTGNKRASFEKVERLLDCGLANIAPDVLVLPEVFATGWCPGIFRENAEVLNGETADFLGSLAKKLNTNIIGGSFIEERQGRYFNTCPVFNRSGELIAQYDKMHIYSPDGEDKYISAGKNPVMVELEGIKTGLTICYDIRFPEIYRAYARAGADLVVNAAAWGLHKPVQWEIMTRSRATENQVFMIALTQSGLTEDDKWNLGHSRVIDYNGAVISEIKDQSEGVMCAEINLNEMYEFREKYGILSDIRQHYGVNYEKNS